MSEYVKARCERLVALTAVADVKAVAAVIVADVDAGTPIHVAFAHMFGNADAYWMLTDIECHPCPQVLLFAGSTVKYANPEPGEESFRFTLVEHRGDRVLLRVLDWPNPLLAPTEVVKLSDVVPVLEVM